VQNFEPQLRLTFHNDEYALDAVTLTPNNCYSPGRATRSAPHGIFIVSEAIPVTLEIEHRDGECGQIVIPIHHHLGGIKASAGKTEIIAFVVLGGKVVGSASIPLHRLHPQAANSAPAGAHSSGWSAYAIETPGAAGPKTLHVHGTVTLPTPGWVAKLESVRQDPNTRDLLLKLTLTLRPGIWPDIVVHREVSYEETHYKGQYRRVDISGPEGNIQIDIINAL
jgi:hypothetical protein